MAKIIKVASSTSTSNTNQINTSRVSTTNPFKYQNFEGHTLTTAVFADVFETNAPKAASSRIKMIASSVAGSAHRIRTSITEPIINFVNRVGERISSVWNSAKEISSLENISGGLRAAHEFLSRPVEIPGAQIIDDAKSYVKAGYETVNGAVVDFGNGIKSTWSDFISKFKGNNKISAETPVVELESMLKSELEMLYREAA